MTRTKRWTMVFLMAAGTTAIAAYLWAETETNADTPRCTIRQLDSQVVVYTIYRGSYDKTGMAVGKLFGLAGQNGLMPPKGPLAYAYLNNPTLVASQHWLTEIRIPVDKAALKLAGTLGEMTDVKTLPAMQVVVIKKAKGIADPAPLYVELQNWLLQNHYRAAEGPFEIFLSTAPTGAYADMESEIMMPIEPIAPDKTK